MVLPQDTHLANLTHMHEETGDAARALLDAYSDTQRNWKPNAKVWSINQCFEHLAIAGELYAPGVTEALARTHPSSSPVPFKATWFGNLFLKFVRPDGRVKIKTLPVFRPTAASVVGSEALDRFWAQHEAIGHYLRRADGHPLNTVKITSPASSLVKLTLGEVMTMLVWHEKRHVRQAQRLIAHPKFPHEAA